MTSPGSFGRSVARAWEKVRQVLTRLVVVRHGPGSPRRAAVSCGGSPPASPAPPGAGAQHGGTPTTGRAPAVVEAWLEAWNADDAAAGLAALSTEDGVHENVPTGIRTEPGGVEALLVAFAEQVSDIEVERIAAVAAGDWTVAEHTFAFRYTGQIEGLPAGTGQRIENRAVTVFELEGDAIRRASDHDDDTGFLAALGLLPEPADAGTGTAGG